MLKFQVPKVDAASVGPSTDPAASTYPPYPLHVNHRWGTIGSAGSVHFSPFIKWSIKSNRKEIW